MRIFGFNTKEVVIVLAILSLLGTTTYFNLQVSLRRGRDVQRKNDLRTIYDGLVAYQIERASFPPSFEGKIVACFGDPCDWHRDRLVDILTGETYLAHLPTDPHHNQGARYYYISNGRYFQIYTALEGEDEAEYDQAIVARNIVCGTKVCNHGLGFAGTPLDKSIEEYENEIRQKQKP